MKTLYTKVGDHFFKRLIILGGNGAMKYVQSNKHEIYQLDDNYIIFNTHNYHVFKVNEVGKQCLQLLEQPQSIQSLINELEQSGEKITGADKQQIEEFVQMLVEDYSLKEVH